MDEQKKFPRRKISDRVIPVPFNPQGRTPALGLGVGDIAPVEVESSAESPGRIQERIGNEPGRVESRLLEDLRKGSLALVELKVAHLPTLLKLVKGGVQRGEDGHMGRQRP